MGSAYNYSLFVRIKDSNDGITLESAPEDLFLIIKPLKRHGSKSGWNILVPLGLSREKLADFLEWLEEIHDIFKEKFELFDPQQGFSIEPDKDGDELIEEIIKHDTWILDNIGGDSVSAISSDSGKMSGKSKLLFWFTGIIFGLYFLTKCSLSIYFS
jgi:hypothetical protein